MSNNKWLKKIRIWLPHIAIVIAGMYIVFYFIDRVNVAMAFINNDLTKFLLLFETILTIFLCTRLIHYDRLMEKMRKRKKQSHKNASEKQETTGGKQ